VFQIAEDQTIPWLVMVVLIVLIHRVMGYFSERQRLHMFRELLKAARANAILSYKDGPRVMTSKSLVSLPGGPFRGENGPGRPPTSSLFGLGEAVSKSDAGSRAVGPSVLP
jgi:hypothetical protein